MTDPVPAPMVPASEILKLAERWEARADDMTDDARDILNNHAQMLRRLVGMPEPDPCVIYGSSVPSHQGGLCPRHTYDEVDADPAPPPLSREPDRLGEEGEAWRLTDDERQRLWYDGSVVVRGSNVERLVRSILAARLSEKGAAES